MPEPGGGGRAVVAARGARGGMDLRLTERLGADRSASLKVSSAMLAEPKRPSTAAWVHCQAGWPSLRSRIE
jgi:hypothetical protein